MIRKPIYVVILGIILITYASLNLAEENTIYYYSTTEIVNLDLSQNDERIRMGGLVKNGSLDTAEGKTIFIVTDGATDIIVNFERIIPDLFQEEIVVVLEGSLIDGIFIYDEMLVKHDNEYKSSDGSTYELEEESR